MTAATDATAGVLARDAGVLAEHVAEGERVLATLPARPDRDTTQQASAERVLAAGRAARRRFLARHAAAVYAELTANHTRRLRLAELADAASRAFPGLVPTQERLAAERRHAQAGKDGHEIDQGLFFGAVLADPVAGTHLMDTMLMPCARALRLLPELRERDRAQLGAVLVERRGRAAHLTVHNTHCLNAEDDRLADDMETATDLVLLDDRIGVGVLRGGVMTHPRYRGRRVFSAGINLAELRGGRISFVDFLLRREFTYLAKIQRGLLLESGDTVEKPWVAGVDTFAIGGGMQLLLVFDRVIAADDAFFSLPAAQEGIVPGVANLRLTRLIGGRLARQVLLFGKRIRADEPAAALICDEVVPAAELGAAVDAAALALDSPAVVANRRMLNRAEEPADDLRRYLADFAVLQAERLYSRDVLTTVDRAWSRGRGTG